MTQQKRASLFALITLLALLFNLALPASVLADDEDPPPAPTEEIIVEEESIEQTQTEEESAPQTKNEEVTVSEILEQLPEDTQIIVLDESGEVLPLVTEEAAEIIISGDPMWCPENQEPGDSGCTPAFADFNSGTGLLQYLITNNTTYFGNGTIFIAYDYDPTTAGDGDITLFGDVAFGLQGGGATNGDLGNLTIQGGWDFGSNTITGQTNFGTNNFSVFDWNGNVTINNINIDGASGNGMNVFGNGDVTLNNVIVDNSDFFGTYIDNTDGGGDVNVNNSTFNNSVDDGLLIMSNGEVNLSNITANDNGNNGASIDNSGGSGTKVNITGSNSFSNNDFSGLFVFSEGDINAANITANNNQFAGTILTNSFGNSAEVHLTGTNVFNGNIYFGLGIFSSGEITLNSVTASENGNSGAYLENCGCLGEGITLTGTNIFNNNWGAGLEAYSGGDITISNVTANYNDVGTYFENDGDVTITNGQFNNNFFGGVGGYSYGDITLENVLSSGNVSGAGLFTTGNVTVKCSIFSNNSDEGITADTPSLNLIGITFMNNTLDYENTGGTVTVTDKDCNPSNPKKPNGGTGFPINMIQGGSADLDCDKYSGTTLVLPNKDKVTFKCPIGGSATLNAVLADILPNALPEDMEYVSALVAVPSPDGSDVALDGLVVVSFIIPDGMQGEDFAILYWNGTEWVDLDTATFNDGRAVINGGYVTKDGYFEALTNFSGNFVLVKK